MDDLSCLRHEPFAKAVTKLEELIMQSGLSFLIGSGCSKCAGLPLTDELAEKVLQSPMLDETTKAILGDLKLQFDGAPLSNIEDYLSELIDLLAIVDRRTTRNAKNNQIELNKHAYTAELLKKATEQIKQAIVGVIDQEVIISTHQRFVRAVHRPIRPGKPNPNNSIDYLILNYDTLIEDALALEKVSFADGLDGGTTGWWNPATFTKNDLAARVLKMHGSINWCELPSDPMPRRVARNLKIQAGNSCVLIWPASTKYRETQRDPYAQLIGLARNVLHPKEHSKRILVICGYGFGDQHINFEIDQALRESDGHLTVISFTSSDHPVDQLKQWHEDSLIREQVLIFAKRGFFHGKKTAQSDYDLPWWKFENLTRLLGGER